MIMSLTLARKCCVPADFTKGYVGRHRHCDTRFHLPLTKNPAASSLGFFLSGKWVLVMMATNQLYCCCRRSPQDGWTFFNGSTSHCIQEALCPYLPNLSATAYPKTSAQHYELPYVPRRLQMLPILAVLTWLLLCSI
eukprot:GHUV01033531.1.p1 GENE.GHUV01033531.1~~GHUV01033531.1.p1  ORF type:complete len:137 (-),score=15.04 GHUV01033531.1:538-948(-)